jgi:hypothetical protein
MDHGNLVVGIDVAKNSLEVATEKVLPSAMTSKAWNNCLRDCCR